MAYRARRQPTCRVRTEGGVCVCVCAARHVVRRARTSASLQTPPLRPRAHLPYLHSPDKPHDAVVLAHPHAIANLRTSEWHTATHTQAPIQSNPRPYGHRWHATMTRGRHHSSAPAHCIHVHVTAAEAPVGKWLTLCASRADRRVSMAPDHVTLEVAVRATACVAHESGCWCNQCKDTLCAPLAHTCTRTQAHSSAR